MLLLAGPTGDSAASDVIALAARVNSKMQGRRGHECICLISHICAFSAHFWHRQLTFLRHPIQKHYHSIIRGLTILYFCCRSDTGSISRGWNQDSVKVIFIIYLHTELGSLYSSLESSCSLWAQPRLIPAKLAAAPSWRCCCCWQSVLYKTLLRHARCNGPCLVLNMRTFKAEVTLQAQRTWWPHIVSESHTFIHFISYN